MPLASVSLSRMSHGIAVRLAKNDREDALRVALLTCGPARGPLGTADSDLHWAVPGSHLLSVG